MWGGREKKEAFLNVEGSKKAVTVGKQTYKLADLLMVVSI